ncbi:hypothetical protein C8R45DRAFT_1218101 [Mycena sanguinolenta]|nr:hypothetical protein C8R45DRAFT_1218101 [Mycena sanguinolenta]
MSYEPKFELPCSSSTCAAPSIAADCRCTLPQQRQRHCSGKIPLPAIQTSTAPSVDSQTNADFNMGANFDVSSFSMPMQSMPHADMQISAGPSIDINFGPENFPVFAPANSSGIPAVPDAFDAGAYNSWDFSAYMVPSAQSEHDALSEKLLNLAHIPSDVNRPSIASELPILASHPASSPPITSELEPPGAQAPALMEPIWSLPRGHGFPRNVCWKTTVQRRMLRGGKK